MRDLPAGTVTFLFTDVEGSTRLLRELGDAYPDALAGHRRVVREALAAHGGAEVDTQGDSFFAAFARASDAVAAAGAIQEALRDGPVRVRIGVHTGEGSPGEEGYVGIDVHRGARVMGAAHGGQVLVSEGTRALLGDAVPLRDLGLHRLKDLGAPQRLYQLGEGAFPPLRTLDATNLPTASTPLLGRERELAELVSLLTDGTRLVTVTGAGGTGKTRLALQAAAELVGRFADGVFWVPLGGLADAALVGAEVAQAVGADDDLAAFVRDRELLVLVDNFEHLLDAAPLLASLLAAAPRLTLLVTSRTPLRISGEHRCPLEPLGPADAAALFAARSRAAGGRPGDAETVAAVCRRLDGLPLAIELAAARTALLEPAALLERLERALPLLTTGARDAPDRQRTLRATLRWSHELLDEEGKRLLSRLGVFSGSFPLGAVEDVCGAGIDAVTELAEASLLRNAGDGRLLLLETVREYARELLEGSGEEDALRERHATFYATLAEEAYARRFDEEAEWAARLEADHDDLRAALDRRSLHDPEGCLQLAGALGWFWVSHSHLAEGSRRLEQARARADAHSPAAARSLVASGALAGRAGRPEEARALLEQGIAILRAEGDAGELAAALDDLGWMCFFNADDETGLRAFEESLELRRRLGDRRGETRALTGVCQILVAEGEVGRTEELSRELLALARADGDIRSEHFAQHYLADCSLIRGDYDEARERYRESLRTVLLTGDLLETTFEIQGIAMAASGRGDSERAVTLAAAVEALWAAHGIEISVPFWDALLDTHIGGARRRLGDGGGPSEVRGRALSLDEAVELALA